jgi:hypothetical protein
MIDSQCNVHMAICVQYRVGATAAQAGSDKEPPILKNTKFDIEGQSFDIVYNLCCAVAQHKLFELAPTSDNEDPSHILGHCEFNLQTIKCKHLLGMKPIELLRAKHENSTAQLLWCELLRHYPSH